MDRYLVGCTQHGRIRAALSAGLKGKPHGWIPREIHRSEVERKASGKVESLEQKLAMGGMTLNLLLVVLIALMVWKPGV